MVHKHEPEVPFSLDRVVEQLEDLDVVLGVHVRPVLAAVRETLIAAMAAREQGDVTGAVAQISGAMDRLSVLADELGPAEAGLMRALVQNFRAALGRGDQAQAKQHAAFMFQRSGAVERKKS